MPENTRLTISVFEFLIIPESVRFEPEDSQYGTQGSKKSDFKILIFNKLLVFLCVGILCVFISIPIIKRKIEMENFEGKVNYHLLHTYLYVSYLDTVKERNELELSYQKDSHLKRLCYQSAFSDVLCLNLIMHENLFES